MKATANFDVAQWPPGQLPVEIFNLIISFLPRSSIQIMRLVNREFEQKISGELFKTVVVPFRPEIYGIAEASIRGAGSGVHIGTCDQQLLNENAAVMLQDKGMRVFQGYGGHIKKFAMSFEVNYDTLAAPPIKSDQEAITTFWGIYRWPFKKYNRFAQLEGLEQTADETMTMTKALRFIENATELGLSIDGGLGWLSGPDINTKVRGSKEGPRVFGKSRFPENDAESVRNIQAPEQSQSYPLSLDQFMPAETPWATGPNGDARRLQILREAGYQGDELSRSVQTLFESEGTADDTPPELMPSSSISDAIYDQLDSNDLPGNQLQRIRELLRSAGSSRTRTGQGVTSAIAKAETNKNYHLKPNDLSSAQKEMLLETEWAQRAFMQSYTIAIIDNPPTFANVKTLTIARLPARHLAILRRADFWDGLSALEKLSLAIIPDWREVTKLPTSWVEDIRVAPSQSISGVHSLLTDHISIRKSIKILHFEWLCGGEEALGIFARNQHILAAPLVPKAIDMITRHNRGPQILTLPYVEDLTLKNCWVSPHILLQFIQTLATQQLRSLTLRSVSLSAPGTRNVQAVPANQQTQHHAPHLIPVAHHFQNAHFAHGLPAIAGPYPTGIPVALQTHVMPPPQGHPPVGPVTPTINPVAWLGEPRRGSWAHFIDAVTPGQDLASMRYARGIDKEPPLRNPSQLTTLCFESCGYIRLQVDLDHSMLDPPEAPPGETSSVAKRRNEIEGFMMKPLEHTLGTIINYMDEREQETLETAWALRFGWGVAGRAMALQAAEDGIRVAGQGRFGGKIIAGPRSTGKRHE